MGEDRSWAWNLGLRWSAEPPGVVTTWTPGLEHRGPPGFLHGGLAATVLDETMAALGYVLDGVHAVTATLNLRYRKAVPLDGSPVRAEAWRDPARAARKVQTRHGRLVLADGSVAVEATGLFVAVGAVGAAEMVPAMLSMLDTEIDCIDCGGRCHLLVTWAPDDPRVPGDIVTYRCSDCMDVWYIEVPEDSE